MKDICIIIPTIRNYGIVRNYLRNARESGFDVSRLGFLLVTEDFCDISAMKKMLFEEGVQGEVVGQSLRDAWFEKNGIGDFKGIIPRKSHAETSFGLLWMLTGGYDYGIFIDDDTAPLRGTDYFGSPMANLGFRGQELGQRAPPQFPPPHALSKGVSLFVHKRNDWRFRKECEERCHLARSLDRDTRFGFNTDTIRRRPQRSVRGEDSSCRLPRQFRCQQVQLPHGMLHESCLQARDNTCILPASHGRQPLEDRQV